MFGTRVGLPMAMRMASRIGREGRASGAFNPASLSGLLLRSADANATYHASTIGGYPVITPEESGTFAQPRGQTCALFDATNDKAAAAAALLTGTGDFTITAWIKPQSAAKVICGNYGTGNTGGVQFGTSAGGKLQLYIGSALAGSTTLSNGTVYHVAAVRESGVVTLYVNGVSDGSGTRSASITGSTVWCVGTAPDYTSETWNGHLWDVRLYNVAKTAAEVLAIKNQDATPSTVDATGILGGWALQEEGVVNSGLHYDWSGNGNHLTVTSITAGTYNTTDSGVRWNINNWKGYTLSGSVVIPANLASPTLDAAGNALGVVGPVQHPVTVDVPCFTGDGTAANINLGSISSLMSTTIDFSGEFWFCASDVTTAKVLLGCTTSSTDKIAISIGTGSVRCSTNNGVAVNRSETVVVNTWYKFTWSYTSATNTLTCTLNGAATTGTTGAASSNTAGFRVLANSAGSSPIAAMVAGLVITSGGKTYYPMFAQCGPGSSNTNRDFYILCSDGTATFVSGGITSGTIANIFANRCPYVQDWSFNYGGGIAANGSFVPGRIGSSNDAAGNAKTLSAGKHGNPFSRRNRNRWGAPELVNVGVTSSDAVAPSTDVQAASVVDTQFARQGATGTDRDLIYSAAQTGSAKTNLEAYTA